MSTQTAPPTDRAEAPSPAYRSRSSARWWLCGVLFLATVLNYLDRQTMAICAPLVTHDFNLSNQQFGELLSAFRWAYAALHIPAGFIADRCSIRLTYALAVGLWSIAGAAAAWARSFGSLSWARVALGMGEAFNWPCGLRVIADVLPPEERALGNGVFQSGTATAALFAPWIIGPISSHYGWRAAFLVIGAMGGLWIVLWLYTTTWLPLAVRENRGAAPAAAPTTSLFRQLAEIFGNGGFWILVVTAACINPCLYFLAEWLPKYMHDQRGFNILGAALITTPVFLGTDLGNLGGGALVRHLTSRGISLRRSRAIVVLCGMFLGMACVLANFTPGGVATIFVLGIGGLGVAAVMTSYLACVQAVSHRNVGMSMGLLGAWGCVIGAVVNPLIGSYVDRTGTYYLPFLVLGILPVVSAVSILVFDAVQARRPQ